uniref:NADH-ubiquinone oxidoreductase chain 4L n=1 Tax=Hypsauchenia hardwickii TaxID=2605027 RepID=A0A5B9T3E7_9HEMI|nr:NADH dehydrogenase subunit 4L [Hypsauchenia hardwickii]QEG98438.1 NADH dehydrogenase subunit 4L [Hypsauchenia hardwickii]
MMNFYFLLMFMGILSLCLIRKHIFMCLISLEFIIIYLLLIIFMYCLLLSNSFYIYIVMMIFFVCEGVLGLSLIVLMIRNHSNDYLNSMNLW